MRARPLSILFIAAAAGIAIAAPDAGATARPQSHFLSWESLNRPEQVRRMGAQRENLRRYKVSKDRIDKLKAASFWNKRPYQFTTPLVVDGRLYIGADVGRFYAYEVPRGKKLWEAKTEGPVQAKAAVADGTVYFGDTKANVYALDAATGAERWRARLGTELMTQPLLLGNRLIIADLAGRLYALERATGAEIWHTNPADRGIGFSIRRASSPTEVGGLIIVGTSAGSVIAYRAGDGQVAWVRQLGDRQSQVYDVDSQPLLSGGRIYASSADGTLAALDPMSGGILWTAEAGGVNDLLVHNGRLFASGQGVLTALDPETGTIFWQQDLKSPEISSPAAGEHFLAVVTTVDKLYFIDTDTGDIVYDRFIRKGCLGDPVIDGDQLYFLSNSSALYGFKVRELPPLKKKETKSKRKAAGTPPAAPSAE